MIVVDEGDSLLLVTQPDHARLAGELVALWREDGLPDHPRRSDLIFAVREHDNGWREADAAPTSDPAAGGVPYDFRSLPDGGRREIWSRGTRRFAADRPYAALLVTLHALALFRDREGDPDWEGPLAAWRERRDELAERSGADLEEAARDYRFLELADAASLAVCTRGERTFERKWPDGARRGRFEAASDSLFLAPFPLAGATTFRVPCRHIPKRLYRGDADLGGELAAARWGELRVRVAAPRIPG